MDNEANELLPTESTGFLFWTVARQWHQTRQQSLRRLGVTHVGFVVLTGALWLEVRGGPVSQKEIASFIGIDKASVSLAVAVLLKKGLVERSSDPADGRAHRISVTKDGKSLALQGIADAREDNDRFFQAIQDKETELNTLLRALAAANNPTTTTDHPEARENEENQA
jgi:DNA-binding MarR family transcriptional regulator